MLTRISMLSLVLCLLFSLSGVTIRADSEVPRLAALRAQIENSPCLKTQLSEIAAREILPVYSGTPEKTRAFEELYGKDPSLALKQWLITTPPFQSFLTPESLVLESIKDDDRVSQFPTKYLAFDSKNPKKRYWIKISGLEVEAKKLWQLQGSRLGDRNCYLDFPKGANKPFWIHAKSLPVFPRIFASASFQFKVLEHSMALVMNESATHRFLILTAEPRGKSLRSDDYQSADEKLKAHRAAGRSLGLFHVMNAENPSKDYVDWSTFSHGSLNPWNVFYDPVDGTVTWLEGHLIQGPSSKSGGLLEYFSKKMGRDLDALAYSPVAWHLASHGNTQIDSLLLKEVEDEASRAGKRLPAWGSKVDSNDPSSISYETAFFQAFARPEVLDRVQKSEAYLAASSEVELAKSVLKGYSSVLPPAAKQYLKDDYWNSLAQSFESIAQLWASRVYRTDVSVDSNTRVTPTKELVETLKNLLPKNFVLWAEGALK